MPDRFTDARYLQIIRPQHAIKGKVFDKWIDSRSKRWQRERVIQIRRYLAFECDYGMQMDDSDECWKPVQVYAFTDDVLYSERSGESRDALVGAACFDSRQAKPILSFIWIHPFWRNQGLVQKAWPEFVERYGQFGIEKPLSKTMEAILKITRHTP